MTDPGFGDLPEHFGAPASGSHGPATIDRAGNRHPEFGKADDAGANGQGTPDEARASAGNAGRGTSGSPAVPGTRDDIHGDTHKRKRRRRARRGKKKPSAPATPDAAAGQPDQEACRSPGPRGGKARGHKLRALQGRPLTCGTDRERGTGRPEGSGAQSGGSVAGGFRRQARGAAADPSEPPRQQPPRGQPAREQASRQQDGGRQNSSDGAPPLPGVRPASRPPLYAALDLGTNNCRLLVAQPTRPGQFRVVDAFSRIVRLGEGLVGSGRLSEDAMARAVEALKVCAGKLESRPIRNRRLIATEACRAAVNGAEFLARVREEAGLDLEIVDRQTEARLAVSGCSSLVGRDARSVVLFDIGGGSSEIAVIDLGRDRSGRLSNHIKAWTSLPVGVVTLSEQHGGREVTRDIFGAMVRDVETMLARFDCPESITGHHAADGNAGFHLLGTSGTVTTLAGVYLDLPRYDRRRVDGLWLSSVDVDRMMERLLSWDFEQRSANPCIGADRADLVLAGCAILEAIRRRWPAERMRVADRGLREGLLTEMMASDGAWRRQRRYRRPGWIGRSDGAS